MASQELIRLQYERATAVEYAERFIGTPYRWGGDDPMAGFDCSGLVVEILQAVGKISHGSDYTAGGLFELFKDKQIDRPLAGALMIFRSAAGAWTHVEICRDEFFSIGASGGRENTTNLEVAVIQNAFVKIRPAGYRGSNYVIVDPFKAESQNGDI